MTKNELRLAAEMLEAAADRFGNDCCTDYEFPEWFSKPEQENLATFFHDYNGDAEEDRGPIRNNWIVMLGLAEMLRRKAGIR